MISALLFVFFLVSVFYKDRKNVKRESILLLRRTKRGRRFIIWLGRRFSGFWKIVGTIGVLVGFYFSFWIFYMLFAQTHMLLSGEIKAGPGVLIPSFSQEAVAGPGFYAVPFWYWIITIAVLVVVHEGFHGIIAASERVKIKSLGWGLLAVIPLAFVEPDERQLKKKRSWTQLRVFAAGSFSNFITAGASFIILTSLASTIYVPSGVGYTALIKGYPAERVNLTGVITGINNYTVRSVDDLHHVLMEIGPDKNITVYTVNGSDNLSFFMNTQAKPEPVFIPNQYTRALIYVECMFPGTLDFSREASHVFGFVFGTKKERDRDAVMSEISFWKYVKENCDTLSWRAETEIKSLEEELSEYPEQGFIGIAGVENTLLVRDEYKPYKEVLGFIQGLLFWIFFINFAVGAFNLLPIGPLDGGRMWEIVMKKITPKRYKTIMNAAGIITVFIILLDFVLVFV